jgi:penicillin-binding protein 1C
MSIRTRLHAITFRGITAMKWLTQAWCHISVAVLRWRLIRWGLQAWVLTLLLFLGINLLFPLQPKLSYARTVVARDGSLLAAYLSADDKWRMQAQRHELSPTLVQVMLAKEDRWFYWHWGINPLAVLRAGWQNISSGERISGASTLSMQCARMLQPKARTWSSKLQEALHAMQLEWHYSKDDILMLYLNHVPYGGNVEGVKAASLLYWGKPPSALSLAECATLAVVPTRQCRADTSPQQLAATHGAATAI